MTDVLIQHRLNELEKSRDAISAALKKLAESQIEISADLRSLISEQKSLTKAMRGIAGFQYEVRQMNSTHARLFARVERLEQTVSNIRDDVMKQEAVRDGKRQVVGWIADHWPLVSALVAAIAYGAYILTRGEVSA